MGSLREFAQASHKTLNSDVAQLVARLLWEDRRAIHSPEGKGPEVLGTVVCSGNFPVEKLPQSWA